MVDFPVHVGMSQAYMLVPLYVQFHTFFALVAQWIEHPTSNRVVVGSNPTWGT